MRSLRRMTAAWTALLMAAIIAISVMPSAALADETLYTRGNTRMREQASETSKTVMIIKGGQPVTVTGASGEWSRVKFMGRKGYIRSDLLVGITKSGYLPLELGNECPQVKTVQDRLAELGYFIGQATGEYLADTESAVREFQKSNGIKVDGKAGGETQRTMFSSAAKAAEGFISPDATGGTESSGGLGQAVAGAALRKGDQGAEVLEMQLRLKDLGYITFTPDGVFGTGTETALKTFQENNGLLVDGKAGGATLTLLNSMVATPGYQDSTPLPGASASASPEGDTLKRGDTGDAVRKFQVRLQALGYITFTPDGVFGTGTERAVVMFQQQNGLKADGKVGPETLAKLNSSSAKPLSTATPTATPATSTTLKRGDTGEEVTKMQKRLRELGYIQFSPDGVFGSGTRDAVIAFQKNNGLTADGLAGPGTLNLMYSSRAKAAPGITAVQPTQAPSSGGGSVPSVDVPDASRVRLLRFFDDVKPKYPSGTIMTVYDPASRQTWRLRVMSMGRHSDSEPLTADDTAAMRKAFGGVTTWTPKAVWVKFPDGVWSLATTHDTPHLSQTIKDNNFSGHLCVHFLRDMEECKKNDPNYGVQHQNAIRAAWKALTGHAVN